VVMEVELYENCSDGVELSMLYGLGLSMLVQIEKYIQ